MKIQRAQNANTESKVTTARTNYINIVQQNHFPHLSFLFFDHTSVCGVNGMSLGVDDAADDEKPTTHGLNLAREFDIEIIVIADNVDFGRNAFEKEGEKTQWSIALLSSSYQSFILFCCFLFCFGKNSNPIYVGLLSFKCWRLLVSSSEDSSVGGFRTGAPYMMSWYISAFVQCCILSTYNGACETSNDSNPAELVDRSTRFRTNQLAYSFNMRIKNRA